MSTPEWEGLLLNIRQALRLGTLTTFERARAFHTLIGHGLKVVDIGRHLRDDGCAQSTVEVAVSTYSRLARPMLDWICGATRSSRARRPARTRVSTSRSRSPRHCRSWVEGIGAHIISRFVDREFRLADPEAERPLSANGG